MAARPTSPAELASEVDALLILVVNAAQTESVLFGETGAVKGEKGRGRCCQQHGARVLRA